jgi:hypothetical protein
MSSSTRPLQSRDLSAASIEADHVAVLAASVGVFHTQASDGPRGEPSKPLAKLDDDYAAAEKDLLRRCGLDGHDELAAIIAAWKLPPTKGRQIAFAIPPVIETPACVDTETEHAIWKDFLAARRARGAGMFEHALYAARAHARQPTRAELAKPATNPPLVAQASCEAIRLLFLTLRDDPLHEKARTAVGQTRRGDRWEWPEATRRLDRGEAYDPAFGWMPKGKLAHYHDGERYLHGHWVKAAEDDAKIREVKHGRQFDADHWEIVSTAPPNVTGELASSLEASRVVWLQVFGAFSFEPADLEKRLEGRSRVVPQTPHSAILCGSRTQYVTELQAIEPRIIIADGIYWQPTATTWFFADPKLPPVSTIRHESFHQLFAESRPDFLKLKADPGVRSGFWAVEAAALYAESIIETPFGWSIGGRDAGRAPAAKALLANDTFSMPLADLTALGRDDFQNSDRLADLYDQCGGLADFFMNAHDGRYREAFVKYLTRVYSGTAAPDTLTRLCRRSYPELDAEYKAYVLPPAPATP